LKTKEFLKLIEMDFGKLGSEEGLRFKYFEDEIKGIKICWMVSKKVLNYAPEKFNLLISHEDLYFPPEYAGGKGEGVVSEFRKEILEKYRTNFVRLHYTLDKYFILDIFDKLTGGEVIVKEDRYRIYKFENVKLRRIAEEIKKKYKLKFLRITFPNKKIKRAGCLWGGLGLSINSKFIDKILSYKVDAVIAGEVDEYTIRALDDINIGIIEIGHEASESYGLIEFKKFLKKKFPEIPVKYIKNTYPIKIL